ADLGMPGDEFVARLDAELLRSQPATRTGGIVRLAAPLRAVDENRFECRTLEPGEAVRGSADPPLVRLGDDAADRYVAVRQHGRACFAFAADHDRPVRRAHRAIAPSSHARNSRRCPITSAVL